MKSGYLELAYDFYKSMKGHEIKLAYEGPVTQEITKSFVALVKAQMAEQKQAFNVQRKVFHVMVECLQNLSRYADPHEPSEPHHSGSGLFIISQTDEYWSVTTGNAIHNEKVKDLTDMIDRINLLKEQELKDLYVKQMQEGGLSVEGGAGLGFMDIRRKTGKKLEYRFLPISADMSFFLLNTFVLRE